MTSNWVTQTSAADHTWSSIAYGNNIFVSVASAGTGDRIMTSPDGITWTLRQAASNNSWQSVVYGNNLFVAVANSGSARVMTSSNGTTWTSQSAAQRLSWISVTHGNGLFVAVSNSGTGTRVMTSPDGTTWTSRTSASNNNWSSITHGNGLFVAVSNSGTGDRVMTSPDGTTWTSRTSASDNNWTSVTHGNGLFVAVSNSGIGNRVMTSPDGINWTIGVTPANNDWSSVVCTANIFVAVATTGTNDRVMTSGTFSCYCKGSKILCLINNTEIYVPIEDIRKGVLIKTYKNGYLPVEHIGKISAFNNPSNGPINCLYKQKNGELIVTGGHYLLVDELPSNVTHKFYELNLTIEDKKILLTCDSDLFEPVKEIGIYELYHFVLKPNSKDFDDYKEYKTQQYGIYAEGVLTETTSKKHYLQNHFVDI